MKKDFAETPKQRAYWKFQEAMNILEDMILYGKELHCMGSYSDHLLDVAHESKRFMEQEGEICTVEAERLQVVILAMC